MQSSEGIQIGLDGLVAAVTLTRSFLASLLDTAFDLLSGRQLPEPDLKSVAEAPEPGALNRVLPPKTIPRPSRAAIRDKAA